MKKTFLTGLVAGLLVLCVTVIANAAPIPVVTSWTSASIWSGGNWTIGYQFRANQNIEVTALGYYDLNLDGLQNATTVTLWNNTGSLLGSATVLQNDTLLGSFRYANLNNSISLNMGETYRIGAGVDSTDWLYDVTGISTKSQITYLGGAWANGQNVFTSRLTQGTTNYISANFLIDTTSSGPNPVPEPTTLILLGSGLAGLAFYRRKRK